MAEEQTTIEKKFWDTRKIILISLVAIIILGLAGAAFYFYQKYQKAMSEMQATTQDETGSIVAKIGKFMELPEEQPTLATVTDKEKVKGQAFFAKTENGDKVLIYTQAQKAILYRPSSNKIIEIVSLTTSNQGNLSLEQNQPSETAEMSTVSDKDQTSEEKKTETVKVTVYNGTRIKGLAAKIAEKISTLPNVEIGAKTNAKGNYSKTLVIDFTKKNNGETAKIIAETLKAEVSDLPSGETKLETDVLIIGGSDWEINL